MDDLFIMSAMGCAKISTFSLRTQPGMPSGPMDLLGNLLYLHRHFVADYLEVGD